MIAGTQSICRRFDGEGTPGSVADGKLNASDRLDPAPTDRPQRTVLDLDGERIRSQAPSVRQRLIGPVQAESDFVIAHKLLCFLFLLTDLASSDFMKA